MDPIAQIRDEVRRIAEQTALRISGVSTGTVLSVNPDGSINVDDGTGGCARVANITNQSTQCGAQVILGVEPAIGNQSSVCPVSITVSSSTKPCPLDDRTDDNETEEPVIGGEGMFVDDAGNVYDGATGALVSTGGSPDSVDNAYGYSFDFGDNSCWVGASSTYDVLKIGDLDDDSGNQGEVYTYATRLALNTVSNVLLGAELKNSGGGGHDDNWKLVLRNSSTYAIIAESSSTNFLNTWMADHPDSFYGYPPYNISVHISPDPEDGHFWVTPQNAVPPDKKPMFKVSSADLSLLATVELIVPNQFIELAKRIIV